MSSSTAGAKGGDASDPDKAEGPAAATAATAVEPPAIDDVWKVRREFAIRRTLPYSDHGHRYGCAHA